jgi:hypothetical protein
MVNIKDIIDPEQIRIYRAMAGGVTTANILHGSANSIGGQTIVLKMRWGKNAQEMIFEARRRALSSRWVRIPKRAGKSAGRPRRRSDHQCALSRDSHGCGGYDSRRIQRSQALQGELG